MKRLLLRILTGLGGAVLGGGLWSGLDHGFRAGVAGFLERLGWPLEGIWLFVAVGALAAIVVAGLLEWRARAHGRRVARACRRMGLAYSASAERLRDDFPGLEAMPLFRDWTRGENRMTGRRRGRPVEVFDATVVRDERNGPRVVRRTVVLLPGAGLPAFEIRPRTLPLRMLGVVGMTGVTFDEASVADPETAAVVEDFNRRYIVAAPGFFSVFLAPFSSPADAAAQDPREEEVRRLFSPRVMRALAGQPGWSAQAHGGYLALWRGGDGPGLGTIGAGWGEFTASIPLRRPTRFWPAGKRAAYLDEALAIFEALTETRADQAAAEPLVAGRPGRPPAQPGRLLAVVLGAVVGLPLGIATGFLGTFSLLASHPRWVSGAGNLLFLGVIAGAVLGTALGAALGIMLDPARVRRFSRRQAEAVRRRSERPRAEAVGEVVGAYAGCAAGALASFLLSLFGTGAFAGQRADIAGVIVALALYFIMSLAGMIAGSRLGARAGRRLAPSKPTAAGVRKE